MIFIQANGLNYKLNTEDSTAQIVKSRYIKGNIYIPTSLYHESHNYNVTKITSDSFKNNSQIKSIDFPINSKLTTIEKDAFNGSSLKCISLPPSVTDLQDGWCRGASCLTKVKISPDSKYFKYLNPDEKIILSKSNQESELFDDIIFASRDIKKVEIPNFIKRIKSYSFYECEFLKTVTFSEKSKVESICKESFSYSSIENIFIPNSVKFFGDGAFSWCQNLHTVEFEEGSQLSSTGKGTFSKSSLKKISIPIQMKTIGEGTFSWCQNLQTIEFPEDSELVTIEKYAFYGSSIKSLTIPSHVEELKESWCRYTPLLTNVTISRENNRFSIYDEKMIIGKSDRNCEVFDVLLLVFRNVETVVVPFFIKHISSYAFSGCQNLSTIEFEKKSNLISIGKGAFTNISFIESISIPKHVRIIGEEAFSRCYKLKKVDFPDDSELEIIESDAFGDSFIESISIPAKVERLSDGWCMRTPKLTKVTINPGNKHFQYLDSKHQIIIGLNDNVFEEVIFASRDIKSATIPSFIKRIKPFSFFECESIKTVSFTESSSLESIEKESFSYSSIEKVIIPKEVTQIGESAFSFCDKLKTVEFQKNSKLTVINKDAFSYSFLHEIVIPNHVKTICDGTFSSCRNLQKIEIDENSELRVIEKNAFAYSSIQNILIPCNVNKVSQNAFLSCTDLHSIEFLGQHVFIDSFCMKECASLFVMSFPNAHRVSIVKSAISADSDDFSLFISNHGILISIDY